MDESKGTNRVGMLADDLTGSSDTGVQFSRLGGRVLVLVALERLPARLSGEWDALVVNSGSRNRAPEDAASRVKTAMAFLAREGWPLVYKKVDSTLRGNPVSELETVLASGVKRAYLAPAFPLTGRTVEGGVLKVDGMPVHRSEIGRDGLSPVATSEVARLIGPTLGSSAARLSVAEIEAGVAAVQRFLDERERDHRVVICDAVDQAHLAVLAEAIAPRLSRSVAVGSAGLARELAPRLIAAPAEMASPPVRGRGRVVVVAGSLSAVTRRQTEDLAARPGVAHLVVDPGWVDGADWGASRAALLDRIADASATRAAPVTILITVGREGADSPLAFRERSARLNRFLGEVIAGLADGVDLRGLVLTGGDIAAAGLEALGAYGIRLGGEVLPGIPLGWLVGGNCAGLPLVTKAGGFGGPDALFRAVLSITS